MKLVVVDVYLSPSDGDELPKPKLDPGEHIVKRLVAMKDLYGELLKYSERGFTVDARLAVSNLLVGRSSG